MSCVYTPEPVSIPCIIEIINDFRTGQPVVNTIRKIMKQVDSGLALFGKPDSTILPLSTDLTELVNSLEQTVGELDDVTAMNPIWLTILIAILKELLKQIG